MHCVKCTELIVSIGPFSLAWLTKTQYLYDTHCFHYTDKIYGVPIHARANHQKNHDESTNTLMQQRISLRSRDVFVFWLWLGFIFLIFSLDEIRNSSFLCVIINYDSNLNSFWLCRKYHGGIKWTDAHFYENKLRFRALWRTLNAKRTQNQLTQNEICEEPFFLVETTFIILVRFIDRTVDLLQFDIL